MLLVLEQCRELLFAIVTIFVLSRLGAIFQLLI
jgi:hypothetical protein